MDGHIRQVVNTSQPNLITGKKTARIIKSSQDINVEFFNGAALNLSTILTMTRDQNITGDYIFDHLDANIIDLRAINGRNLTDYVRIAASKETQSVEGNLAVRDMIVHGPLTVESREINGCNLSNYHGFAEVSQFDSLTVDAGGTLTLEDPLNSSPELASLVLRYFFSSSFYLLPQ